MEFRYLCCFDYFMADFGNLLCCGKKILFKKKEEIERETIKIFKK